MFWDNSTCSSIFVQFVIHQASAKSATACSICNFLSITMSGIS